MTSSLIFTYLSWLEIPFAISSFHASKYQNRVPTLTINVLSRGTWRNDLSDTLDYCRLLKIPIYAVFSPYNVATRPYKPPFLRCYILRPNGSYLQQELREITLKAGGAYYGKCHTRCECRIALSTGVNGAASEIRTRSSPLSPYCYPPDGTTGLFLPSRPSTFRGRPSKDRA